MIQKNTRRGHTQQVVNAVNQNKCHSRGFLSGIFNACCCKIEENSLLNTYVEDPRLRPSGMTPLYDNGLTTRGFTLIELLVVVLIIGILAAVALPQYQVAVKKAQYTELLQFARDMQQAQQIYLLEHGSYSRDINELPINLAHIVNKYQRDFWILYYGHNMDILPTNKAKGPGLRVYYPIDITNLGNAAVDNRPLAGRIACMASSNMDHKVCQKLNGLPAATGSNLYFLN